jgi:uncharacterized protein (DUF952 family)
MPAGTIYKLLTRAEWEAALAEGVYRGSAHDLRDGFIHFSTAAQLGGTARKYFAGVPDLILLAVDVEALTEPTPPHPVPLPVREGAASRQLLRDSLSHGERVGVRGDSLRWEPARDGSLFPHLYADLLISAVKTATGIPLDAGGIPILPAELAP